MPRAKPTPPPEFACVVCGVEIGPNRKTCSPRCRQRLHRGRLYAQEYETPTVFLPLAYRPGIASRLKYSPWPTWAGGKRVDGRPILAREVWNALIRGKVSRLPLRDFASLIRICPEIAEYVGWPEGREAVHKAAPDSALVISPEYLAVRAQVRRDARGEEWRGSFDRDHV